MSLRHNNIVYHKDMILCQALIVYMLNFQDIHQMDTLLWDVNIFEFEIHLL
jgi:hypothetical protein